MKKLITITAVIGCILFLLVLGYWAYADNLSINGSISTISLNGVQVYPVTGTSTPPPQPPVPPQPPTPPEPPPTPPSPGGEYNITSYGQYGWSIYGVPVPRGSTVTITFKPKAVGATPPVAPAYIWQIRVEDNRHKTSSQIDCYVEELDASGKVVRTWLTTQGGQDDWPFSVKNFNPAKFQAGEWLRIVLKEAGVGPTSINVKID